MSREPMHAVRQRGFSLIEMMIGITLGVLIMMALTSMFVDVSRNNREMAKTNSQIENARFAFQLLQQDLVHAGYWGGFVPPFDDLTYSAAPPGVPGSLGIPFPYGAQAWNTGGVNSAANALDTCRAYSSSNWDDGYVSALVGLPVQVFDTAANAGCATLVTNQRANTDILVVRHAETCQLSYRTSTSAWEPGYYDNLGNWVSNGCEAQDNDKLYFQPSYCEDQINPPSPNTPVPYKLGKTGLDRQTRQCNSAIPAPKYKYVSSIYYIRNCSTQNVDGTCADAIPTLVRSEFGSSGTTPGYQPAVPLVEGIEGFRIELGIDQVSDSGNNIITATNAADKYTAAIKWADPDNRTSPTNRGDGVPDVLVHCGSGCTPAQLANATGARIYLLARATEPTPGYTDTKTYTLGTQTLGPFTTDTGYKRHAFSSSVRFTNISGRRETP